MLKTYFFSFLARWTISALCTIGTVFPVISPLKQKRLCSRLCGGEEKVVPKSRCQKLEEASDWSNMAQALRLVLLTGFVLAFQCIGANDSMETHEEEKRFKTSPFTWSNPLSGYNIVLVRVPNHSPQEDKYQLQVIRGSSNPFSNQNSPSKMRQNYVLKWFSKYPYQTKG